MTTTLWTTHVKASPDAVFAELSNLMNHAKWSKTAYRAQKDQRKPHRGGDYL